MVQRSMLWDGSVLGDCGPYTQAQIFDRMFRAVFGSGGDRGPLLGWLDGLEVSGSASPLTVAAGGALVYGMPYETDAAVSVAVPTPSSGTSRYDRVVVRRTWSAKTSRVYRIQGVAAATPAVPALVQTVNVTWDVPLATVLVDDGGAITISSDDRTYCSFGTLWGAGTFDTEQFAPNSITADKIPDRSRWNVAGGNAIRPDSGAACTRAAAANWDYWSFADAAFNRGWAWFLVPPGTVGYPDVYVWSTPVVNGAGGGAENCQWDYWICYGTDNGTLTTATGTVNVDQQARVNTTPYADQLVAALPAAADNVVGVRLSRDGAADSYNSAMQLHVIELRYTHET